MAERHLEELYVCYVLEEQSHPGLLAPALVELAELWKPSTGAVRAVFELE